MSSFRLLLRKPPLPPRITPRNALLPNHRTLLTTTFPSSPRPHLRLRPQSHLPAPLSSHTLHRTLHRTLATAAPSHPSSDPSDLEPIFRQFAQDLINDESITPSNAYRTALEYRNLIFNPDAREAAVKTGVWWGPAVVIHYAGTGGNSIIPADPKWLLYRNFATLSDLIAKYGADNIGQEGELVGHWEIPNSVEVEWKASGAAERLGMFAELVEWLIRRFSKGEGKEVEMAVIAVAEMVVLMREGGRLDQAAREGKWWGPCVVIRDRTRAEGNAGIMHWGFDSVEKVMAKYPDDLQIEDIVGCWVIPKAGSVPEDVEVASRVAIELLVEEDGVRKKKREEEEEEEAKKNSKIVESQPPGTLCLIFHGERLLLDPKGETAKAYEACEGVGNESKPEQLDEAEKNGRPWGPCVLMRRMVDGDEGGVLFYGAHSVAEALRIVGGSGDNLPNAIARIWIIPEPKDTTSKISAVQDAEVTITEPEPSASNPAAEVENSIFTGLETSMEHINNFWTKVFHEQHGLKLGIATEASKALEDLLKPGMEAQLSRATEVGKYWGPVVIIKNKDQKEGGGNVFHGRTSLGQVIDVYGPEMLTDIIGSWVIPKSNLDIDYFANSLEDFREKYRKGEHDAGVLDYVKSAIKYFETKEEMTPFLVLEAAMELTLISFNNDCLEDVVQNGRWWGPFVLAKSPNRIGEDGVENGMFHVFTGEDSFEKVEEKHAEDLEEGMVEYWVVYKFGGPPSEKVLV